MAPRGSVPAYRDGQHSPHRLGISDAEARSKFDSANLGVAKPLQMRHCAGVDQ